MGAPFVPPEGADSRRARVLLIDDRSSSVERLVRALEHNVDVTIEKSAQEAIFKAAETDYDVMVVSLGLSDYDALRLCAQVRALERTRNLPILIIADAEERPRVLRGLELGVNDWLSRPVDRNELIARVRTQVRLKRYADGLREQVQQSIEMALIDPLTGLNNRRYLDNHLSSLIDSSRMRRSPLSLCIFDIDHFKRVNDSYGHDVGDQVLQGFAQRLKGIIRTGDLLCRLGGEEFIMAMPGVNLMVAARIAERARCAIEGEAFAIRDGAGSLTITTSIGVAERTANQTAAELYHAADQALYRAKSSGRNRVVSTAA
jgi:two-component system cell cycle response regulator